MLFVLSPAKTLDFTPAEPDVPATVPDMRRDTAALAVVTRKLKAADLKRLMDISDALAELNVARFKSFDGRRAGDVEGEVQAAFAFAGDVYDGLDARTLDPDGLAWAQDHLRILSGLYGLLRPLDRIQPYRLEMGVRLKTDRGSSLYDFWGDKPAKTLNKAAEGHAEPTLINLASQEYFGAVDAKALKLRVVTCHFKEEKGDGPRIVSFFAKQARGRMARYAIDGRIERAEELKGFDLDGYVYRPDLSGENDWTFTRPYREPLAPLILEPTMSEAPLFGHAAIVTGSTSGIGQAMADALAGAGADVVLNGLGDPAKIEAERAAMAERHGVKALYHGADMSKGAEIADMVAFAHQKLGRLDILVNNAGIQHVAPVEDFPPQMWDQIIAINLTSAFHATRAALPIMKAQGRGRIVNIASAHALVASPFKSAYVASKHGVLGLTKTVALEVAEQGITCTAICPGYVKTPLVEAQITDQAKARGISEDQVMKTVILAAQPTKKFVEFDQLAGLLLYLVSDAGASVNGAALSIDGGWTAA